MHLTRPLALVEFLAQSRQQDVGTVPLHQCLLVMLPLPGRISRKPFQFQDFFALRRLRPFQRRPSITPSLTQV